MDTIRPNRIAWFSKRDAKERSMTVQNTQTLIEALKAMGSTEVTVEFSGCGDDGEITEIWIDNFKDTTMPWLEPAPAYPSNNPIAPIERKVSEVIERHIENIIYHHTGVDWVNNEGGEGTITIDVEQETVDIHIGEHHRITKWSDYTV